MTKTILFKNYFGFEAFEYDVIDVNIPEIFEDKVTLLCDKFEFSSRVSGRGKVLLIAKNKNGMLLDVFVSVWNLQNGLTTLLNRCLLNLETKK